MLATCEGCSKERRERCAARQQTWVMGTVLSGIDDGVALGNVRDQEFHVAANVRGRDAMLGSSGGSVGTD